MFGHDAVGIGGRVVLVSAQERWFKGFFSARIDREGKAQLIGLPAESYDWHTEGHPRKVRGMGFVVSPGKVNLLEVGE